jgi:WD40 repeat protein
MLHILSSIASVALSFGLNSACLCVAPIAFVSGIAPESGIRKIDNLTTARAAHAATLLSDGRVLITGGFRTGGGSLSSAEIFAPATDTLKVIADLATPRAGHTASRLPDGRVLIAGGYNGDYLQTTEIFDPATGRFSEGPNMTIARSEHTATTLTDGRILIVGGVGTGWTFLADAEIFDPASGSFTAVSKMSTPRESHTATLLKDGRVLITGGHKDRRSAMTIYSSTEIFSPTSGTFETTGNMTIKRHKHAAVRLQDGSVLIVGGSDERDSRGAYSSLEIFDPRRGEFKVAGEMRRSRYKLNGAITLLPDGKVLIAGGSDGAEIFDPASGKTIDTTGDFGSYRLFSTATTLGDGRVLIVGGYDQMTQVSSGAWIFEPVSDRE